MINVSFSKKIHDRDTKRTVSKTLFLAQSQIISSDFRQEASDIQASAVSPSGKYKAVLRQTTDDKPKRYVEIWVGDLLQVSKDVTSTHGSFCTEGESPVLSSTDRAYQSYYLPQRLCCPFPSLHLRIFFCIVRRPTIRHPTKRRAKTSTNMNGFDIPPRSGKGSQARSDPAFISFAGPYQLTTIVA